MVDEELITLADLSADRKAGGQKKAGERADETGHKAILGVPAACWKVYLPSNAFNIYNVHD
jgi:hypothetical protein